jgi:hypothetical protein
VNSPPANRVRTRTRTDAGKLPTSSNGPDPTRGFALIPSLPSAYTSATAIDEQFDPSYGTTISRVPVSPFRPLKPSAKTVRFRTQPSRSGQPLRSFPLGSTCIAFGINSLRSSADGTVIAH